MTISMQRLLPPNIHFHSSEGRCAPRFIPGALPTDQEKDLPRRTRPPGSQRRCQGLLGARLEEAKARHQAQALLDRSALLRDLATEEKIWIVPALYNLASGKVQFFKPVSAKAASQAHH
jgi:carbonic anhydrase